MKKSFDRNGRMTRIGGYEIVGDIPRVGDDWGEWEEDEYGNLYDTIERVVDDGGLYDNSNEDYYWAYTIFTRRGERSMVCVRVHDGITLFDMEGSGTETLEWPYGYGIEEIYPREFFEKRKKWFEFDICNTFDIEEDEIPCNIGGPFEIDYTTDDSDPITCTVQRTGETSGLLLSVKGGR